jgi:RNA-binding protein
MPKKPDRSMQDLKPTVWIGKQGCTETMIEEIVVQLKKRKMIKVKWLQNADVDPESLANLVKARLVEVRGRTMVLALKGHSVAEIPPGAPKGKTARATGRMKRAEKSTER